MSTESRSESVTKTTDLNILVENFLRTRSERDLINFYRHEDVKAIIKVLRSDKGKALVEGSIKYLQEVLSVYEKEEYGAAIYKTSLNERLAFERVIVQKMSYKEAAKDWCNDRGEAHPNTVARNLKGAVGLFQYVAKEVTGEPGSSKALIDKLERDMAEVFEPKTYPPGHVGQLGLSDRIIWALKQEDVETVDGLLEYIEDYRLKDMADIGDKSEKLIRQALADYQRSHPEG